MPDPTPIRILVTGFGAFPGVMSNPSEALLGWIGERLGRLPGDVTLKTAFIPATWEAAERFTSQLLANFDPDIALHFGLHRRAAGFRIETLARNCACTQADADSKRYRPGQMMPGAPRMLRATLNADKLTARLRAHGAPAAPSLDAGRYVCNMLFYLSLHQSLNSNRPRQTSFIHIPPLQAPQSHRKTDKAMIFSKSMLLAGADVIIAHCIDAHRHASHASTR